MVDVRDEAEPTAAFFLHAGLELEVVQWVKTQALAAGFGSMSAASELLDETDTTRYALVVVDEAVIAGSGLSVLMRRLRPGGSDGPAVCLLVSTLTPKRLVAGWAVGVDIHIIKSATVPPDQIETSILALNYPDLTQIAFRRLLQSHREQQARHGNNSVLGEQSQS